MLGEQLFYRQGEQVGCSNVVENTANTGRDWAALREIPQSGDKATAGTETRQTSPTRGHSVYGDKHTQTLRE